MALVAQQEREAISRRTKEALQAVRRRGITFGNPNGARALRAAAKGNGSSLQAIRSRADEHARDLQPVLAALVEEGVTTLAGLATALNDRGMLTPRQRQWHPSSVRNLQARLRTLG